jgi:hypothetical protein
MSAPDVCVEALRHALLRGLHELTEVSSADVEPHLSCGPQRQHTCSPGASSVPQRAHAKALAMH